MEQIQPRKCIEDQLVDIQIKLDRLLSLAGDDLRRMTITEIADYCKCSRASLYKGKRYLLPDFGQGLSEGRKFTRKEVFEWLAKGEVQLRKEWKEGGKRIS